MNSLLCGNRRIPLQRRPLYGRATIAGEIHRHLDVWDKLTQGLPNRGQIMG